MTSSQTQRRLHPNVFVVLLNASFLACVVPAQMFYGWGLGRCGRLFANLVPSSIFERLVDVPVFIVIAPYMVSALFFRSIVERCLIGAGCLMWYFAAWTMFVDDYQITGQVNFAHASQFMVAGEIAMTLTGSAMFISATHALIQIRTKCWSKDAS